MRHTWLLRLLVCLAGLLPALAGAADTYQYDEVGNLQSLSNEAGTRTYTYDEVNRLDQESGPAGARNHAYDANGNRTSDGAGTTATYSASTDRLATINGTAVSLDAAGNITSDGTNAYTWDAAGRLKTVSRAKKLWATYYYDYKSRRSRKETTSRAPQGAQVVVYHYDQDDHLLAETLATGAPLKTYLWDDGRLVGLLDHGTTPPTLLTLDLDQLGTPRAARNAQGTVVWRWDSDGYGTTLPNEDPDGNGTKTTLNLRFPGQYYDQESGLHYNWNRYYSPKLGRYISADPIGVMGGANLYQYGGGNPISRIDPDGRFFFVPLFGPSIAAGLADLTTISIAWWITQKAPPRWPDPPNDDGRSDGEPWPKENKDFCIRTYANCKAYSWTGNCQACLDRCLGSGSGDWPFDMCRPRKKGDWCEPE